MNYPNGEREQRECVHVFHTSYWKCPVILKSIELFDFILVLFQILIFVAIFSLDIYLLVAQPLQCQQDSPGNAWIITDTVILVIYCLSWILHVTISRSRCSPNYPRIAVPILLALLHTTKIILGICKAVYICDWEITNSTIAVLACEIATLSYPALIIIIGLIYYWVRPICRLYVLKGSVSLQFQYIPGAICHFCRSQDRYEAPNPNPSLLPGQEENRFYAQKQEQEQEEPRKLKEVGLEIQHSRYHGENSSQTQSLALSLVYTSKARSYHRKCLEDFVRKASTSSLIEFFGIVGATTTPKWKTVACKGILSLNCEDVPVVSAAPLFTYNGMSCMIDRRANHSLVKSPTNRAIRVALTSEQGAIQEVYSGPGLCVYSMKKSKQVYLVAGGKNKAHPINGFIPQQLIMDHWLVSTSYEKFMLTIKIFDLYDEEAETYTLRIASSFQIIQNRGHQQPGSVKIWPHSYIDIYVLLRMVDLHKLE